MELYFKDLEGEGDGIESLDLSEAAAAEAMAEEIAFAELTERVSAARLVY